jgi:hypothetical protein
MDFKNMGAKRVCVVTDTTVRGLDAMRQVEEGLTREGIEYTVYDGSRVEPKDSSYVFISLMQSKCRLRTLTDIPIGLRKLLLSQCLINPMPFSLLEVDL